MVSKAVRRAVDKAKRSNESLLLDRDAFRAIPLHFL